MTRWILGACGVLVLAFVVVLNVIEPEPSEAPYDNLIEALKIPDKPTWDRTVMRLVERGPTHVPRLVLALEDEHRAVREGAAHVLGNLGPAAADAVPALIERVNADDDDFVRWKAVRALGFIGPAAEVAVPLLQVIVENETELLQASAKAAIKRIRGEVP